MMFDPKPYTLALVLVILAIGYVTKCRRDAEARAPAPSTTEALPRR